MYIMPTILTTTQDDFENEMNLFSKHFSRIQLDVADGKMAPNVTVQIPDMIASFQAHALRIDHSVVFDFHLMVQDFEKELVNILQFSQFAKVGVILVNVSLHPNLVALKHTYPDFAIGLDVYPDAQIIDLAHHYDLSEVPAIQLLSVTPGFQGSPFKPEVLEKIEQLRDLYYKNKIFMDGGINATTIPQIVGKKHKPNFLCVGSYLTKAGAELEERIKYLRSFQAV